eukprot:TRINITY_DN14844_c0_g1_i1.p1 TRINITY_DN14844_c0_g1~~TRINITY_DN14844_c0_g1_i1.p1  ORF type:complete len:206 (-),score=25.95 TRINITY_DN14844_c0_g1_i1:106-723(-)
MHALRAAGYGLRRVANACRVAQSVRGAANTVHASADVHPRGARAALAAVAVKRDLLVPRVAASAFPRIGAAGTSSLLRPSLSTLSSSRLLFRPKLFQGVRAIHKFAKPDSPNLDNLRRVFTEKLVPVHFYLITDGRFTNWVWDMHFRGICCSPKFEGKTYKEINDMVNALCKEVGMEGRVRMTCEPPSRWFKLRRLNRKRWHIDM